jgi:hypothetical protein
MRLKWPEKWPNPVEVYCVLFIANMSLFYMSDYIWKYNKRIQEIFSSMFFVGIYFLISVSIVSLIEKKVINPYLGWPMFGWMFILLAVNIYTVNKNDIKWIFTSKELTFFVMFSLFTLIIISVIIKYFKRT